MSDLELIFLGHQSWWVRSGDVNVLIDPVLGSTLGNHTALAIHPPRSVDISALQSIDMVVLTHEHNDHFDLRSLARLDRSVPILVAPLMPAVAVRAVERLGFTVHRAVPEAALGAAGLHIQMLPAGYGAPVGEARVAQVLISTDGGHRGVVVLIGVDIPISELSLDGFHSGRLPSPDVVVVANNTQIPPPGVRGSAQDLFAPDLHEEFAGLELLRELCVDYLAGVPGTPAVVLSGGGFVDTHELGVPYAFDDHPTLAKIARTLAPSRQVYGPTPGTSLRIRSVHDGVEIQEGRCPAIQLDTDALETIRSLPNPQGGLAFRSVLPFIAEDLVEFAIDTVDTCLNELVPGLLAHPFGRAIVECHFHNGVWQGPRRLLVHLITHRDGNGVWRAFDLAESAFIHIEPPTSQDEVMSWPFGFEMCLQDLYALFLGELVVWDVLGLAMRHWSAERLGVASVFCELLGEGARADAFAVALAQQLTSLEVPTDPSSLSMQPRVKAVPHP